MALTDQVQHGNKPLPQPLFTLTDRKIMKMAKNHGITLVSADAKDHIRRVAYLTMETIIEEAKLYTHGRVGYTGIPNLDSFNQKSVDKQTLPPQDKKKSPGILIQPCDIAAVLRKRGIVPY
jgi:hypothetical protein